MKLTNATSFPIIAFGWHTQHGYGMDTTIAPGEVGEVSGPYLGEMDGGDCFIHLDGEIVLHEGPDGADRFHIGQGEQVILGDRQSGITVRHHLDQPDPQVVEWREENYEWGIEGYDTFDGHPYPLQGAYDCRQSAERAAHARLLTLEQSQPGASSGGQSEHGIQDHVFVIRPNGSKYRYTGNPSPVGSLS